MNGMNALRLYMVFFSSLLFFNAFAERNALAFTSWRIDRVQCRAVATDAANQTYVDSSLAFLQKSKFSAAEALECEFTDEELVNRSKGDSGRWKYKLNDNRLIVNFGNGKLYILDVKSISPDEMVLSLDKKRFFISDYAPKDETLPSRIHSLELELRFKRGD